jgi:lipoyl synthase
MGSMTKGKVMESPQRIPSWLKMKIPGGSAYAKVKRVLARGNLRTVCVDAKCPNIGECFCSGHATFLIMGGVCTRNCKYCAVHSGVPQPLDENELQRIALAIKELSLGYAVITSVTRDDLSDGGATHFAECVNLIRKESPGCKIELLIPDFKNSDGQALRRVIETKPDVLNHNIEVTKNLFTALRPQGDYEYSLGVIKQISDSGIVSKSGLMIGFGETLDDIISTLGDLKAAGCANLTVGQYLRSTADGFPVAKFYTPEEFDEIAQVAKDIGFAKVLCGPLVRSSYRANDRPLAGQK